MELHGFFEPILYSTYIRPLKPPLTAIFKLDTSNFKLKLFLYVHITYLNFTKIHRRFPADRRLRQLPNTAVAADIFLDF